MGKKVIKS